MSTAANLPPRAKRLSLRLADFGLPIPPRIVQFLDGPEVEAHDGSRAWGLAGFSGDTKIKVRWASSRLYDIHDYATGGHFEEGADKRYLPIAALGTESRMFVVDLSKPELPVYFFDSEQGFDLWADDFEQFLGKLLRRGDKTPSEKLEKAYEAASAHNDAKQYTEVLEVLLPVVARFPKQLSAIEDAGNEWANKDELGAAYNLIGIAYEKKKDVAKATAAYQSALELGCTSAGLNLCDLYLDEHKDYARLVEFGEKQREQIWSSGNDNYAWFHIRNYLGQGYLLTGRPNDAIRTYHQIHGIRADDPAKVAEAIDDLRTLRERPEADVATIESILRWFDLPAPELAAERLAALRAWWKTLPEAVGKALREKAKIEAEQPTDDDLGRIALLDDVDVKNAELTELGWVTMLDRLEDLDVKGNELTDISPVATLKRLRRLDISENKVANLRPLANLTKLERLSAGENPLAGLEGLENLHTISYLHVNEAQLTSIAPLRGLRGLVDVTIYNNQISDLSPLSESMRIKEISSFGNPVKTGLASLGRLPWLESVDCGDDTDPKDAKALRAANPLVEIEHYPDDDDTKVDLDESPDPSLRAWWQAMSEVWHRALDGELDEDNDAKGRKGDLPSDEALLKLSREDHISIEDKLLFDLEPLRKFSRVDYLNLCKTGIVDLSPLSRLPRLRDLLVRDNKIDLSTLAPAEVLEELYIERCGVTSLAGIASCRALRELWAEDNQIEDLMPLSRLQELRVLELEGNKITDLTPLASLPRLHTLEAGQNRIVDLAPLSRCTSLRVVELWANPPLRNGLALADLPDLTKVITHGALSREDLAELRKRRPDVIWD